jgi:hypothetical protein
MVNPRYWACTGLAAVVVFLILLAALHFLEPDFDPSKDPISEYELGRCGWVMALAFFSLGLRCWRRCDRPARRRPAEGAGSDDGGFWQSVWHSLAQGFFIHTIHLRSLLISTAVARATKSNRRISIPKNVWHRPVIPEGADWLVVSFHTVPPDELIEERPGRKTDVV